MAQALTETQVQQQLHLEEADNLWQGGESLHATSPSAFVMLGLDLEDAQYGFFFFFLFTFALIKHLQCHRQRICHLLKELEKSSTGWVPATITEQQNMLRSCLRSWEGLQLIYMPGLLQYQTELIRNHVPTNTAATESEHPEDAILWLPSSIPVHPVSRSMHVATYPARGSRKSKRNSARCNLMIVSRPSGIYSGSRQEWSHSRTRIIEDSAKVHT